MKAWEYSEVSCIRLQCLQNKFCLGIVSFMRAVYLLLEVFSRWDLQSNKFAIFWINNLYIYYYFTKFYKRRHVAVLCIFRLATINVLIWETSWLPLVKNFYIREAIRPASEHGHGFPRPGQQTFRPQDSFIAVVRSAAAVRSPPSHISSDTWQAQAARFQFQTFQHTYITNSPPLHNTSVQQSEESTTEGRSRT